MTHKITITMEQPLTEPPEGFEFTGEFRKGKTGEMYYQWRMWNAIIIRTDGEFFIATPIKKPEIDPGEGFELCEAPHIEGYELKPVVQEGNYLCVELIPQKDDGIDYKVFLDAVTKCDDFAGYVYEQRPDEISSFSSAFISEIGIVTPWKTQKKERSIRPKWVAFKKEG